MDLLNKTNHKPLWHFSPKQNWINDPNGLIYFNGEYHLFYQYHPGSTVWGPMHWGHAVSPDLVHWEELDIALYPDANGAIFSGSAVVDWNNTTGFFPDQPGIVAIFTSHKDDLDGLPPVQSQSLAFSHDNGRTWTKYEGNPVLRSDDKIDFRDPKVFWHNHSSRWIMVLATGQTISIYSSTDLKNWTLESEFGEGIGFHDGVWECPDLFELEVEGTEEHKWILFVSVGDHPAWSEGSRTQYFIGSFDGTAFKADDKEIRWLDYGRDNYAGVSFSDMPQEDGRRIYIGWMSNWRYANLVPSKDFRGSMTAARQLALRKIDGQLFLCQYPVHELGEYFTQTAVVPDTVIPDQGSLVLPCGAKSFDLKMEVSGADGEFKLVIQHNETQYTELTYTAPNQQFTLERANAGLSEFSEMFKESQAFQASAVPESFELRILGDTASVEVFLDNGRYAMTSLQYPDDIYTEFKLQVKGSSCKVKNISISTNGPRENEQTL